MQPNRSNNYCCGGGGGFLQSGFKDERLAYGKLKDDQIQATKADYCIAGCHNCHAQIHELSEHYGAGYGVVHLWTLICLSLGVLGPENVHICMMILKKLMFFILKWKNKKMGCWRLAISSWRLAFGGWRLFFGSYTTTANKPTANKPTKPTKPTSQQSQQANKANKANSQMQEEQ